MRKQRAKAVIWTEEMDDFIRANYTTLGATKTAQAMNLTYHQVQGRAKTLGVRMYESKPWTDDEIKFMRENWAEKKSRWCADRLGRALTAVAKMAQKLELEPIWKYRHQRHDGYYVLCFDRDNPILEHRYVMEQHLGRKLDSEEIIHYINGIKSDNRLENLVITNRSDHMKEHHDMIREAYHNKRKQKI